MVEKVTDCINHELFVFFLFIVTFTHLNVKNLQTTGTID